MSVARRPLLTATAAGALLFALWFVPSANATDEGRATATEQERAAEGARLAETGGPNTTPYVIGGTGFLAVGAGFVALAMRRGGRAH
ncbi:LAETG motif-containing sortase-dependent surface protein [Streptomyces sp. P9(2023)]|uniref:LAETG motif-containing sortase-dependent surface protein n=1 Tax=Streptomyces sp. P9(2023) TaxID=3064394 RepID=UPI0028F42153|nr:LAETG motif-containing sortase-dependent surface protein [Streptomyces sp. P9(2023)]MDT9693645.1 LAETG motif-containing sortase-dependent surface protein [Streptomyces sp. P9(2023)]